MSEGAKRTARIAAAAAFSAAFYLFYRTYVPFVPGFQLLVLTAGALLFAAALWRPRAGVLAFLLLLPLSGNWPYHFGITRATPHAPMVLVLFLFLALGWLVRAAAVRLPSSPPGSLAGPIRFASALVAVSAGLTWWKWANFYPFRSDSIYELTANSAGVTAGGARMSTVFGALSYLAGFAFFVLAVRTLDGRRDAERAVRVLGASLIPAALFSYLQAAFDPGLGNASFWVALKQINGTFSDPNAFGAVLAMALPLLLAAAIGSRGAWRWTLAASFALGLIAFPLIGARSALLGLVVGLLVSGLIAFRTRLGAGSERASDNAPRPGHRRRVRLVAAAAVGILVLGVFLVPRTRLFQRLTGSVQRASRQGNLIFLSPERYFLWKSALDMALRHPLTGVGAGAFIIELPDQYLRDKTSYLDGFDQYRRNDSAENYALQAAAELGLPGLLALVLLFAVLVREAVRATRRGILRSPGRWLFIGAAGGLAAFAVNALFHSYAGSFETQIALWFLAALVVVLGRTTEEGSASVTASPARPARTGLRRAAAAIGLVLYAGLVFYASGHGLSLAHKTAEFGLDQEFGLYPAERTADGREYRWTGKDAAVIVRVEGNYLRVPVFASHPDIAGRPVRVRFVLAENVFGRKRTLGETLLRDGEWKTVEFRVTPEIGRDVMLVVEVDRTWVPFEATGVPDPRRLGVALGVLSFRN